MLRPARACSTFGVCERIRVPAPAARTRTADSPCVVIEPPRCWPLAATRVHVGVPPSVQRVIIRTVTAKVDAPPPGFAGHEHVPTTIFSAWFGNEYRDGQ